MDHSNMIISVVIVLCIAVGVTAYSIINPDRSITNLLGYTSTDIENTNDGKSPSNNGINNGSGDNNRSSSSNGRSSSSSSTGSITASEAKKIVQGAIEEPGTYTGSEQWDSSMQMWVVKVYDRNGKVIDSIGVDSNRRTNRV